MTTISDGISTFTPLLVKGYETEIESRNVLHEILDRADVDVTLREASLRKGKLVIICTDSTHAAECVALHARRTRLTITREQLPGADMSYVFDGALRVALDEVTLELCIVEVDYQEVLS